MSFSTLPPDSRTLVSKWNTKLALIWKDDFGPLDNSPVLLLFSPGKTPLTTTVAKFLDTSVCGALDALTPASVHSLWSSPKFLNRFCLTILIRLRFSRLVVHLFLPHVFLPLNVLLTCLDTALCEQPASLAMNVCGLPSLWRVLPWWRLVFVWMTLCTLYMLVFSLWKSCVWWPLVHHVTLSHQFGGLPVYYKVTKYLNTLILVFSITNIFNRFVY